MSNGNATTYNIQLIDDDELPPEHNWTIVEIDDEILFIVKRTALSPRVLAEAWGAYRRLDRCRNADYRPVRRPALHLA